ncbi:MAG: hypothetical protein F6K62_00330 [Sphaerospermopsis sp. SIO1G2]|nr:hypothetical protein [Sphaerospermopsis sp. SIO1G2]
MSKKNSITSFCKELLAITGLSLLTVASIPTQAFSFTTEITETKEKTVAVQQLQDNSLTSFLNSEASELLIAKKDKDDDDKKYRYRYDKKGDDYKYRKGKRRSSRYHKRKNWNCHFKVGRYINRKKKSLVLYLDILEKPETRYANVVYQVYARKKNKWKNVYTSTGARLIKRYRNTYRLEPEVVELKKLKIKEKDLYKTDLKFVARVRYDYQNRRDQRWVIEDTWNYDSITEYSNIAQVTEVNYTTTTRRDNYTGRSYKRNASYRRNEDRYERKDDKYDRYDRRRDDDDDDDDDKYDRYERRRDDKKYDRYNRRRDDDKYDRRSKYKGKKRYSYKAYKNKDWDCVFKLGRLVRRDKKAFIVHLDIRNKPATKYADVAYYIYARQNNRWVAVHRIDGKRSIKKKGKRYYIKPEVIDFRKLQLSNTKLSRSDLKFVTEISYETQVRRKQKFVVENIWNYSSIGEIESIEEIEVESI